MAITIDWGTKVITVPQADLTLVSGSVYELDVDSFRLSLRALEDNEEGIWADVTHNHNTEVTLGGATYSRIVEIINGYTVTFEDGQYAVNLVGANNNIADVTNVNQVSIRSNNSAGLITVSSGSGLSTEQDTRLKNIEKRQRNEFGTDPVNGRVIHYDDDDSILEEGDLWEDFNKTQRYRGQGAERRGKMR